MMTQEQPQTRTRNRTARRAIISLLAVIAICCLPAFNEAANGDQQQQPPTRPLFRARAAAIRQQQQAQQQQTGTGSAVEVPAPPINKPVATAAAAAAAAPAVAAAAAATTATNRTVRTADVFQNGDGYNIFVTNTCERESMKVNIKTSRPFYGLIHTRNQRNKSICSVEGTGETDYNLEISHVLNQQDPNHCGVLKAKRQSPDSKDTLSVVVAVRVHRTIELPDDKFFLLNCTNRCRKPDCSSPSAKLVAADPDNDASAGSNPSNRRDNEETERESGANSNSASPNNGGKTEDECTIWRFPWAITLLWCLGILLLAMIISHCIMCSSMICKCVKTEIEEREPSVYEGATDYDDDELYNKRHPYRIDYDNKDIYKTSNNYEPYRLEEAQTKSRPKHRAKSSR